MDARLARKKDEIALAALMMCDRRLFGEVYQSVQSEYFWRMPQDSGVLVHQCAPTSAIFPGQNNPGDIDLLIIPYEGNYLVANKIVAVELKVIRASYQRQGKSPNDFGYTQACHLLRLGFPYAAVIHLIVSDDSPPEAWEEMSAFRVLDSSGRVAGPETHRVDTMPISLMNRAFGRLLSNCPDDHLGLVAAYLGKWREDERSISPNSGFWFPNGREAELSPNYSIAAMTAVCSYYERARLRFFESPDLIRWKRSHKHWSSPCHESGLCAAVCLPALPQQEKNHVAQ